ncbi:hypothetical protein SAMD00023353_8200150 [Rosellinia necatrix]|uniref:Clr5 domain-containing protein n=1 Tax=Rosellinia necatrix TaxID=77044 RepID=A0A1W2TV21_ROSNE|nr:hypothetical protein SAMD00023353_8200150 [Rosellinia necatrix]
MGASRATDSWATANDWANHRPLITSLYRDQNKTLKETKKIMEEKHGFSATVRMYKARFAQWGIQKKIRAEDAIEIFRQQSAREAAGRPSTAFYIGGRRISPDRIRRYRYRAPPNVSERILKVEKNHDTEISPTSSRIHCRTPSPGPDDPPILHARMEDPADLKIHQEFTLIVRNYIVASVEGGLWQASSASPVPDAFTWAHYLATSRGLIAHNRTNEGFQLLNACFAQYKSHLLSPDPFFWLATYKAALLLGEGDTRLANMFLQHASDLTSTVLPSGHPFNHFWARVKRTGLQGLQQHAALLFESYLSVWKEKVGLLPPDRKSLIQMAFVFIQLHCSGMISYNFTRDALEGMMEVLSGSLSGQFLLQEAKFRMACLFLEERKFDKAEAVAGEILAWITRVQESDTDEFEVDHLRCKCLWTIFEIEDKRGNIERATQVGEYLVELCSDTYGRAHLQTMDAISALESFYARNENTSAIQRVTKQFNNRWNEFSSMAPDRERFPHTINQPWLHRCIELKEEQNLIQEVVDLLEQSSLG